MIVERQAALERLDLSGDYIMIAYGTLDMMSLSHSSSDMDTAMYLKVIDKTKRLEDGFRKKENNVGDYVRVNHLL